MSNGTLKGRCASCNWTTRRTLKNMNRKPCPKCGGPIHVYEDDREQAVVIAVVSIAAMAALALFYAVLDPDSFFP